MTTTAKVRVPIHQVDGYVWCDAHAEIHENQANLYEEDETNRPKCNAEAWRPVFTTDSDKGTL